MSKAMSGWQRRIVWAPETNIGTAVTPTVLWNSTESDSLAFGEEPIDMMEAFTGARGAISTQLRTGIYAPGGDLGAAPIYMDGSSTDFLNLCHAFFQKYVRGTVDAEDAIYSYTFTQTDAQLEGSVIRGLTVLKDTGFGSGKCPQLAGAVIDSMAFAWDFGGAITMTPTLMALSAIENGTAPAAIAPSSAGYLQAPNISATFNGTAIHPVGWKITLNNNIDGVPGPSNEAWRTFSYGQATGEVELKVWADDDFYAHYVTPYDAMTVGTLVITANVDVSYGTQASGTGYTAIWTVYTRVPARPEMALARGEMVDTVTLTAIYDSYPSLAIHSVRTSDL